MRSDKGTILDDMEHVSAAATMDAHGILTGWSPNAWSLGLTLLAVLFFAHPSFGKRWPQDATLGVLFTVSGAAAVLLVAHTARGNEEVVHLVQGNLLAMTAAGQSALNVRGLDTVVRVQGVIGTAIFAGLCWLLWRAANRSMEA